MTTFGLVHGAWHGGWCWEKLVPELEARGHRAVAPDLPAEDLGATWEDYGRIVADALAGVDGDVVLVGHSMAGMTIPVAAGLRPVRRLVFLCALIPPGAPHSPSPGQTEPQTHPGGAFDALIRHDGWHEWPSAAAATATMYQDCSPEDVARIFPRLCGQSFRMWSREYPMKRWPDTEIVSILCTDDRAMSREWTRWAARNRLGVEPIELPGGHSPFVSRPADLADALVRGL
jgi:pimeloyl-ACP methyl ester carboxylesterase